MLFKKLYICGTTVGKGCTSHCASLSILIYLRMLFLYIVISPLSSYQQAGTSAYSCFILLQYKINLFYR